MRQLTRILVWLLTFGLLGVGGCAAAAVHHPCALQVEVGEEPGLEYDADSEDELDALSGLCGDPAAGLPTPLRFKLLHNLWSAGVPRSRRITIVRAESAASAGMMA